MDLYTCTFGNGPDLVLLHGWGLNSTVWKPIAEQLSSRYRVTLVDLPGHGISPASVDLSDLDSVCRLLREHLPDGAIWIGWSLGGLIAMAFAIHYRHAISRLIIVAGSPRFCRGSDWDFAISEDDLLQFSNNLEGDHASVLKRFISLQVSPDANGRTTLRKLQAVLAETDINICALSQGLSLLRETDLRGELFDLTIPVRFILGGQDRLIHPLTGKRMSDELKNCRCQMLKDSAHAPFLDDFEGFSRLLKECLND